MAAPGSTCIRLIRTGAGRDELRGNEARADTLHPRRYCIPRCRVNFGSNFTASGLSMIRFRLAELLADRVFREDRRIEWREVAEAAGIHRTTISRMLNSRGYNASMSNLDALCKYFGCQVGDLAIYVPDEQVDGSTERSFRGPKTAAARNRSSRPTRTSSTAVPPEPSAQAVGEKR